MRSSALLSGLLGAFFLITPLVVSAQFSDVPATHPYAAAIEQIAAQGMVHGYPDGTFHPNHFLTRAEAAKIIAQTLRPDCISPAALQKVIAPFSDVGWGERYAPWVCSAVQSQFMQGYSDGTFKPAQNLSFVEAAKLIALLYREQGPYPYYVPFDPSGESPWFRSYVYSLTEKFAVPLSIHSLTQSITRGEFVEILLRMQNYDPERSSRTYKFFYDFPAHISTLFPHARQNFFVIIATVKDREQARRVAADAHTAWVLDTSLTTNLAPGYQAVVEGPFRNREEARRVRERAKTAYIKDAGTLLWPDDYPLSASAYPPGLLHALLGELGMEDLRASTLNTDWDYDMGTLCERLGPAYGFTPLKAGKRIERSYGPATTAFIKEMNDELFSPDDAQGTVQFWVLERNGQVVRTPFCWD